MKNFINKNNVKISYSCMINIKNIIKCHNSKILQTNKDKNRLKKCNCRKKHECQLKIMNVEKKMSFSKQKYSLTTTTKYILD